MDNRTCYPQYSLDLPRLCIYVRKLTANEMVRAYREARAAETPKRFDRILFETQAPEERLPGRAAVEVTAGT